MASETTNTHYKSALSRKQRWANDNIETLFSPIPAVGLLCALLFLLVTLNSNNEVNTPLIQGISTIGFAVSFWSAVLLWKYNQKNDQAEIARIDEILENHLSAPLHDWFGLDELVKLRTLMIMPRDNIPSYSWHYADEMTLHRITYIKAENQYLIESKALTAEDLKLINTFGHDHKIVTSILEDTAPADAPTANQPTKASPATAATSVSTTEWFKTTRKNTPEELIPAVTDIRQFIDTANISEVTEEEKHTIQRVLKDSAAAVELHQKVILRSKVLPNAESIKAEADTELHRTIHALKAEAEQLVTKQAETAMEQLRVHANYVDSVNK